MRSSPRLPIGTLGRFLRAEDDPSRFEILGIRLMRGSAEDVDHAADAEIGESRCLYDFHVLLNEKCAGNSTRPQVNVGDGVVWQWLLNYYVSDLEAPSRRQDSVDLLVNGKLVRAQVDNAVGDHHIDAAVG